MSAIEWTERTLNIWSGCTKVDPACAHCYIERTPPLRKARRRFVRGDIPLLFHLDRLRAVERRRKPTMYFVNSISDTFHEGVPDERIAQLWTTMARCPQHTFQVLTKRIERARDLIPQLALRNGRELPNVWVGTTIGNRRFVHRADVLRETPAAVRFISAEPLLGPLVPCTSFSEAGYGAMWHDGRGGLVNRDERGLHLTGVDWLIAGGESGPRHRRLDLEWMRDLRDACRASGTAFFVKQLGGKKPGSKLEDLPEDLRIREMPRQLAALNQGGEDR